jgi:hypothetical protein
MRLAARSYSTKLNKVGISLTISSTRRADSTSVRLVLYRRAYSLDSIYGSS